jgi:acetyltransferase-like isoleucine patch superfamily enzyme
MAPAPDLPDGESTRLSQPDLDHPGLRSSPVLRAMRNALGGRLPVRVVDRLCRRWEGGQPYSRTLRELLWRHNRVIAGAYSYGALVGLSSHPRPGLCIGRYVSMALSVRWGFNHPLDRISTTPAFYPGGFGDFGQTPKIDPVLEVGHDAWLGDLVVITPSCRRIGVGAVIGAGAIVTRDIPDYAVAFGNPARVVRYRFDEALRRKLIESRWWDLSLAELAKWQDALDLPAASPRALAALEEIAAATRRPGEMM